MPWKRKSDDTSDFDAVNAAEELDEVLGQEEAPNADAYIQTLESEIEGLTNLLNQKEVLLARTEAREREHAEEVERIKKRLQTESNQVVEKRVADMLSELLDLGDDLGRAILAAREMKHNPAVVEGIELVRQSFGKRLVKLGVSRIMALGSPFDPNLHEAVSVLPVDDPAQDGVVMAVMNEGFILNDKVLRPARVAVGKLKN